MPAKEVGSISVDEFLEHGWNELGVDSFQAKKIYSDIASQAFERYFNERGLKGYSGSGGRLSWWADIKTAPLGDRRS
ncbi:hypothetical protein [Paraburkholderia elongata]|uniref:Uncharacterized protein n=1 Tax=Paraburkholderia elongata TaxID=2675747 RepID=A0A972NRC7_9BURK|nr:hypothetical protein [Paraburkholderia elongata]NPT57607.1 hypothetical protein [Paraburkholderia elongata]